MERDLAIIKKVHERAQGQMGQSRLDAKVRLELEGPVPDKERGRRDQGIATHFVNEWMGRKVRQRAPRSSGARGLQGPMPQRAPLRAPGPLEQLVGVGIEGGRGVDDAAGWREVDVNALLE